MKRALVVCPGRGSYDRASLGQLQMSAPRSARARDVIDRCDAHRRSVGEPTVTELDAADRYRVALHAAGEHASLLTFACSLADLADLSEAYEVVGVTGNSMGFYTALAAAGALSLDDAIALVDTMGRYQRDNVIGGQLLYPVAGADWREDADAVALVDRALAQVRAEGHGAWWSIRLGGHAVLGADSRGLARLIELLPPIQTGAHTFPLQLPLHSAFHTPLLAATSERARHELADLGWQAPRVPLVDGRGYVFRPGWADPDTLRDYTLGHQVVLPYDFTAAIQAALAHLAPDVIIALGPGNPLGGPIARIVVQTGWSGIRSREAFEARQATDPILLSFGLGPQRRLLV